MNKMNYILLLMVLLYFTSCNSSTKIYFNDHSKIDDGEIWGSRLNNFFTNNENVIIYTNRYIGLNKELKKIKGKIQLTQNNVEPDDSYYDYAFIIKNDTLYADYRLEFWRYKNFGTIYKLNDTIKSKIKSFDKNNL